MKIEEIRAILQACIGVDYIGPHAHIEGRDEAAEAICAALENNTTPKTDLVEALTLKALHEANIARQAEWCPDQVPDLSFRGNELAGETGEACNVIKKLERERQGWRGSRATLTDLAEELADVVICADLCAVTAGIDLSAAVVAKFNATSDKVGISVRLAAAPLPPDPATPPEGGKTLREALEAVAYGICGVCGRTNDPKTHCTLSDEDADAGCDGRKCFWATVPDAQGLALAALSASQTPAPAAGQQTVATPRDGGVREALVAARQFIANGIEMGFIQMPDAGTPDPAKDTPRLIDKALAALSAPGSAGPGEKDPFFTDEQWRLLSTRSDPFDKGPQYPQGMTTVKATPTTVQPNTGETGAKERARKRIQALGAALSRRDWSATESAYEAIRNAHDRPEIYDAPLRATTATKAETPGPAEGAR